MFAAQVSDTSKAAHSGADSRQAPIIVVGSGPVGMHAVRKLLEHDARCAITVFGNEPWEPYNRVQLSAYLYGGLEWSALNETAHLPPGARVLTRYNTPVVDIDREAKRVIDVNGERHAYSSLILATGSSPLIPNIPGIDMPGVFSFRNLDDVQQLLARRTRSRKTVILGGGALGLEAARAMQRLNTEVTVLEHSPRLMNRQLDDAAGEMLREHLVHLGIQVHLFDGVKQVLGDRHVSGVRLNSGREIECDTIVVVTGIKPNVELARDSGLSVGRGIRVNDNMQTRDADIYAVGECAEHRGNIYGLVAPGLEQAAVATQSIMGSKVAYTGSISATRLKVIDRNVFSMGITGDEQTALDYKTHVFQNHAKGLYRKLVLKRGKLVGAIAIGDWPGQARIQESISGKRRLWPWQLLRFRRVGDLWPQGEETQVSAWPAGATVCNCRAVNRGQLTDAMRRGCRSVEDLARATGASTVCGSCKPLLAELAGEDITAVEQNGRRVLLATALLSLLAIAVTVLSTPVPYAVSMIPDWSLDALWRDPLLKQITGFTLLGLSLIALLLSLRKRIKRLELGDFAWWRIVHTLLGVGVLVGLFAHTGFRLGENLNLALMSGFLLLSLSGALSAGVTALDSRLDTLTVKRLRNTANRLHLFIFWPLPALLAFHVLAVYYF